MPHRPVDPVVRCVAPGPCRTALAFRLGAAAAGGVRATRKEEDEEEEEEEEVMCWSAFQPLPTAGARLEKLSVGRSSSSSSCSALSRLAPLLHALCHALVRARSFAPTPAPGHSHPFPLPFPFPFPSALPSPPLPLGASLFSGLTAAARSRYVGDVIRPHVAPPTQHTH
ncbi:hypothetical protein BST61_g4652 [Cercospora zeina]